VWIKVAQLIKLRDYISRYETDIFHYPSQFVRLKQENWKKLKLEWQEKLEHSEENDQTEPERNRWNFFHKTDANEPDEKNEHTFEAIPQTEEELKYFYLNKLFQFQLKWASTTISNMSFIDKSYDNNVQLRYFLQRIPDNYLVLYEPIFSLKNHLMDGDIILISPLSIEVITLFEQDEKYKIIADEERVWYIEERNVQTKVLSPIPSLKRTEKVIQSILDKHELDFPIYRTILAHHNVIEMKKEPYRTRYVDKINHEDWLKEKRKLQSPIKFDQLKIANAILQHCETTSFRRPEWHRENDKNEDNNRQNFNEF
jgi:hypothetical protein